MTSRKKRSPAAPSRVGEPVQVYLADPDRERLERLATRLGATKSDVLRRGLEALEHAVRPKANTGRKPAPLPTYRGRGLRPGVDLANTAALLDLMDGRDAPR